MTKNTEKLKGINLYKKSNVLKKISFLIFLIGLIYFVNSKFENTMDNQVTESDDVTDEDISVITNEIKNNISKKEEEIYRNPELHKAMDIMIHLSSERVVASVKTEEETIKINNDDVDRELNLFELRQANYSPGERDYLRATIREELQNNLLLVSSMDPNESYGENFNKLEEKIEKQKMKIEILENSLYVNPKMESLNEE